MRDDEELIQEIENANDGAGPDPVTSVHDPALARVAVAQVRVQSAERALDEAVAHARETGSSWAQIGQVLGMTRQGANKRFTAV